MNSVSIRNKWTSLLLLGGTLAAFGILAWILILGDPPNKLYAAQQATAAVQLYRFHSIQTVKNDDRFGSITSFEILGEANAPSELRLVMSSSLEFANVVGPSAGQQDCLQEEFILISDTSYSRCDDGPWAVKKADESISVPGLYLSESLGFLIDLEDVRQLSDSIIEGTTVLTFEGMVNPAIRAAEMWPDEAVSEDRPADVQERKIAVRTAFVQGASITVRVFIGEEDSLIRRLEETVTYPGSEVDVPYTSEYRLDFYDFGAPISIAPPVKA